MNKSLIIVAVLYNIFHLIIPLHPGVQGPASITLLYIFPAIWLITILLIAFLLRRKKRLSKQDVFVVFFCTPLPLGLLGFLFKIYGNLPSLFIVGGSITVFIFYALYQLKNSL